MQNKLFILLYLGFILCLVSIAITNIYLLGLSELICFPVAVKLFILNLKKQN
jgi:membrane protein implicated in regulation of membrane protease activity